MGAKFASIYVGYGFKHGGVAFNPTTPSDIIMDPTERKEKPEPTPLEAAPEPDEPDTDAVQGEGEEEEG